MKIESIDRVMRNLLLASLISITLFVSPWNSTDPINLPKMFLLGLFGFSLLGLFLSGAPHRLNRIEPALLLAVSIFVVQSFLVFVSTESNLDFKLYGTPSRNTGYLTYTMLVILLISTSYLASKEFAKFYLRVFFVTSSVLASYGIAQSQGFEVFNYVTYYSNNVFSTFGNSNFHSGFMGMSSAAFLTYACFGIMTRPQRLTFFLLFALSILNVSLSSSQGFVGFSGGFLSAMILYLYQKRRHLVAIAILFISFIGFVFFVLGLFNVGPFAKFVYETSVRVRGFYWDAGIRIMKEHPFFGVGFDGYGDWFNRSRSLEAYNYNASVVADSAHNVPLDVGTSGGFLLLIAYLVIHLLVLRSVFTYLRSTEGFDAVYVSLFSAWAAYQIQSLLSINQIGLGIWGWTLTGLLIGYQKLPKIQKIDKAVSRSGIHKKTNKTPQAMSVSVIALFMFLGMAVSAPPYLAGTKFYKALQSGDYSVLISSAYLKPYDRSRFFNVALILKENGRPEEALRVLLDGTKIFPDYYSAWKEIRSNPEASPAQIAIAEKAIRRLEPYDIQVSGG
jgi:hypothetical protein